MIQYALTTPKLLVMRAEPDILILKSLLTRECWLIPEIIPAGLHVHYYYRMLPASFYFPESLLSVFYSRLAVTK